MWCEDYCHSGEPLDTLALYRRRGAEAVFNLSSSPFTWQKSDKRNRVVRQILARSPLPFFYVNQVGAQNNGKNIIVFDGDSTAYDANGGITCRARPWREQLVLASRGEVAPPQSEIEAQYAGILTGAAALGRRPRCKEQVPDCDERRSRFQRGLLSAGACLWPRARVCGQHADALQCRGYPRQCPLAVRCAGRRLPLLPDRVAVRGCRRARAGGGVFRGAGASTLGWWMRTCRRASALPMCLPA